jgi:hypothetical protein
MASLDSLRTKYYAATGTTLQTGTDTPVAIRLFYVGTGSVTSVTVISATSVATISTGTGEGTKTYTFGAGAGEVATIGALADAINGDGIFNAKVLDCLRSLACDDNLKAGAPVTAGTDANGVICWDLVTLTAVALQLGACLSAHRDFGFPMGHRVKLQQIVYLATLAGAGADKFQIWRRRGTTETQILGALSVSAASTTTTFASGQGFISGNADDEFVVLLTDTVMADNAGNLLRIVGRIE